MKCSSAVFLLSFQNMFDVGSPDDSGYKLSESVPSRGRRRIYQTTSLAGRPWADPGHWPPETYSSI
jgi:hypothetical protein